MMLRFSISSFALALLLAGCAGSHKPAESPDFTEKGWSEPSPELTSAKTDRPIQADGAKTEVASAATPSEAAPAPAATPSAGGKSDADSALAAAVIRGDALPPPPPTTAVSTASSPKGSKAHKTKKGSKKKGAKTN
jgi:hypothetical protein